jgi:uncharacterized protein (DUF362 family)
MKKKMDRREFVQQCAVAGVGVLAGSSIAEAFEAGVFAETYELCSVTGDKYFDNTMKAVDALGGMKRFVRHGDTVGMLINSPFDNLGTHTNPDIVLAVMKMCQDAGAKQISAIHETSQRYWRRSSLYEKMKTEIDDLKHSDDMTEVTIDKGKSLKKAEISKTLLSCDVFINVPIIKDHEGTRFTGNLKNMMGACSSSTCRFFHYGGEFSLFKGAYSNPELLSQCIADVNLVRRPNLSVVDATEILTTNGPSGPGVVKKPREIIASTNGVAADMYGVRHLGLTPEDLLVFNYVQQNGLGPKSLKDVHIRTI